MDNIAVTSLVWEFRKTT